MSSKQPSTEEEMADFLAATLEHNGVACSTVKDGHVLLFKRDFLQRMLDRDPDKKEFIVFVQRPEFNQ